MNAPPQLSDSVNIKKKGANVCNVKRKTNRCANNLFLRASIRKNSSPPPKKMFQLLFFLYSKVFCATLEDTHKNIIRIFPNTDNWISQ